MSRHGYTYDDDDPLAYGRYRGAVQSAIRGKRGQKLLRDLKEALEAMPVKRLVRSQFEIDPQGDVCALGAVGRRRGVDMRALNELVRLDEDDSESIREAASKTFDVAECLASEVMFLNDDHGGTPEQRWFYVHTWVCSQIEED
jgi:hypothetical protein